MFKRILVGLDGSALAEQILPYAGKEAENHHATLVLLHLIAAQVQVPALGIPGVPGLLSTRGMMEEVEKETADAMRYLQRHARPFRAKGIQVVCITVQGMSAGQAIVQYADQNQIDLIAIATHGRSGLGRLVFGSVADFVLK